MPPVVIAAAAAYAGFITGTQLVLTAVAYGITQYQLSKARQKARDSFNASLSDRTVMTATVDQARTRCYGRVRNVDGVVFKGTWGDKKQFYTLVIALCGHEIDGVERVMFGDSELVLDGSGRVLTAPWGVNVKAPYIETIAAGSNSATLPRTPDAGSVVGVVEKPEGDEAVTPTVSGNTVTFPSGLSGFFKRVAYQFSEQGSRAVVTLYNGGDGQDLSSALATRFPGQIVPGAHRFAGMACLMVELAYDQDAFPNGVPNPITAVFRAAKVHDPRTGVTAWSENPGLIARDWSLYANGGGCELDDLVDEDFIAAANVCDVMHAYKSVNGDGTEVITNRPMYTCGITCNTAANPLEGLAAICETMAGDFAWPGGRLSVRAGAYTAPVGTITGDWLSDKGPIDMVKDAPMSDLLNVLVPTIANSANRYVVAPIPRVAAQPYIDVDGEELVSEVQFEGITDSDHAGHVASVLLKDARAAKTYTLPLNLQGLKIKIGQNWIVDIPEIGLSNEVMRCVGWRLDFEKTCCFVTLKATSASVFDPDAEFARDDALPNSSIPNPFNVPDATGITMASGTSHLFVQADGSIVTRVLVSWSAATDEGVLNGGSVEVRYGTLDKAPSEWQIASVPGGDTQVYLTGVEDGRVYGFMVRFRNKLVGGKWSGIQLHAVTGKSQPPAAVAGLAANRVLGALVLTRTPTTEADWANTIYEYSTNGGASWNLIPAVADRSGATWTAPVIGALKIRARDVDTSGNLGVLSSAIDVTVAPDDVGGASATLSIKSNQADFAGPAGSNYNEAYIHGHDGSGAPADIPGTIKVNGSVVSVPNGPLFGSTGPVSGVIVWDNGGPGFSTTVPATRPYVIARKYNSQWQYDNNSGWVNFTPATTHFVIGQIDVGAMDTGAPGSPPGILAAVMFSDAQLLSSIAGDSVGTNPGDALNSDPYVLDASKWDLSPDVSIILGPTTAPGAKGASYLNCSTGTDRFAWDRTSIPVDPTRTYNFSASLFAGPGNNRNMYLVVRMFRADGREYGAIDLGGYPGAWGGTYGGYAYGGKPAEGVWTVYGADFGAGTTRPLPSDVSRVLIGVWHQYSDGSGSVQQAAQFIRLTDVTAARAAGLTAVWTGVTNRPKTYRVGAVGLSATGFQIPGNLYDADTGEVLLAGGSMYRVGKLNRITKAITDLGAFNPLSGAGGALAQCNAMAAALNSIDSAHLSLVFTNDEPQGNRLLGDLPAAMYRNGASQKVWGSPAFRYRGAYILVGIGGCGEGNGAEFYAGAVDSDVNAWCEATFQIAASGALVVSGSRGANTLLDYGYVGSLDATTNKQYDQETDPTVSPGGVVDGALWRVPSTGRKYQRVSGAWRFFTEPGTVGTGEIAPGAATRLVRGFLVGPVASFNDV